MLIKLCWYFSATIMYFAMTRWMAIRLEIIASIFYLALTLIVVFITDAKKNDELDLSVKVLGLALVQALSLGGIMQYGLRQVAF